MISIMNYLNEGQVLDHIKRNKGNYVSGAIGLAVVPEVLSRYHKRTAEKLGKEAFGDSDLKLEDRARKLITAGNHAEKHYEWKESPINLYKYVGKYIEKET